MTKKRVRRVVDDASRLTYDYASSRLSDGREAVVVTDHVTIQPPLRSAGSKTGRSVSPFNTTAVVQLMVEGDDTPLFTCRRGDYVTNNAHGVYMHTTHHDRVYNIAPRYPEDVIKLVLRTQRQLKHDGVKAYNEATADELNKRGVKTVSGRDWTSQMVHHLVQDYGDRYRTRLWKRRDTPDVNDQTVTKVVNMINVPFPDEPESRLAAVYESARVVLADIALYTQRVAERVIDLERLIVVAEQTKHTATISDEEITMLRRKAAKFDRLFSLASEDD